jgi:predicted amidophosphoribosyltransferase
MMTCSYTIEVHQFHEKIISVELRRHRSVRRGFAQSERVWHIWTNREALQLTISEAVDELLKRVQTDETQDELPHRDPIQDVQVD